tara:strand:+ start:2887 stop:5451 length:2565 start_codon:yes stop_codon:yes gene_type:complete
MAKFTKKISKLLGGQTPDFVLADHPKFVEFLKSYYTFMESAELIVTSVQTTDGILLETETNQTNELLLEGTKLSTDGTTQIDADDKVLLESSTYGKFTVGETITGSTSGATATVLSEDLDNGRLFISAQDKFKDGETITGNSSAASATLDNYRPNPVQNIQDLVNFRDPDKVISNFLTKFRNEFLNTLPETLDSGIDKRKLIKNIKSVYRAKGTARGHELFFKLLFNLGSETIYPREQMLKTSDGKFDTKKIMRSIATDGETLNLIGRTVTGQTSEATAIIENVFKFQIGANTISEFILNDDSITGTFQIGEEIRGTQNDEIDTFIKATITGIPTSPTISNDGALHTPQEAITITGGGQGAIMQVEAVGSGGITDFIIDNAGTGYSIGDDLVFDNTGTGGGSAVAKVSLVNGGITQEESTSTVDDHIVLEDETVRGDIYTGNKIVQETGNGDITDIRIINNGSGYRSLPTIDVTSSGSNASVFCFGREIGKVQAIKVIETGAEHQNSPSPPTVSLRTHIVLGNVTGGFIADETVTSLDSASSVITATVVSYNSDTNILTLSGASGTFDEERTLTASGGGTAIVKKVDAATATTTVTSVIDTDGTYINQDGFISETTMKIQDSLYYQDFSYVIKVGRTINDWRDSFKKTMHTGGFYFTGLVNISSQVDAQIQSITGLNSGATGTPIKDVLNTLFSKLVGRRLGTTDDGTSLASNPELAIDVEAGDSVIASLGSNERDVTLNRAYKIIQQSKALTTHRENTTKFGLAVAGPRMKSIHKFVLGGNYSGEVRVEQVAAIRMESMKNTSLYNTVPILTDYQTDIKINFAIPSEIFEIDGNSFDETKFTFDTTNIKFDVA